MRCISDGVTLPCTQEVLCLQSSAQGNFEELCLHTVNVAQHFATLMAKSLRVGGQGE
jgi:hypothetical protein